MRLSFSRTNTPSYSALRIDDSDIEIAPGDSEKALKRERPSLEERQSWLKPMLAGALIAVLITIPVMYTMMASQRDHLIDSMVPRFRKELRKFTGDGIYLETGPEADEAWLALVGPTGIGDKYSRQGFVRVDVNLRYPHIKPGQPVNGKQRYGISMYHQLHCLTHIRTIFLDVLNGRRTPQDIMELDKNVTSSDFFPEVDGFWHLTHCFDYLRQALQCAGDMSLEPPTHINGKLIGAGWGASHECVNPSDPWEWMIANS